MAGATDAVRSVSHFRLIWLASINSFLQRFSTRAFGCYNSLQTNCVLWLNSLQRLELEISGRRQSFTIWSPIRLNHGIIINKTNIFTIHFLKVFAHWKIITVLKFTCSPSLKAWAANFYALVECQINTIMKQFFNIFQWLIIKSF